MKFSGKKNDKISVYFLVFQVISQRWDIETSSNFYRGSVIYLPKFLTSS